MFLFRHFGIILTLLFRADKLPIYMFVIVTIESISLGSDMAPVLILLLF